MRLPRLRFTVRWLMIAVAIVALSLFAERRWSLCRERAKRYAFLEQFYARMSAKLRTYADKGVFFSSLMTVLGDGLDCVGSTATYKGREFKGRERMKSLAGELAKKAEHYAERKRRCLRAAYWPWLAVPPKPVETPELE
jgi:hypothetical protein